MPVDGEELTIDPRQLNLGKQLRGTWGGDTVPDRDFPEICRYVETGTLDLKPLIADTFTLERINDALECLSGASWAGRSSISI